jgi:hypothetical protein
MFAFWVFFCVAASMFASIHRNRSGVGWFFVAFFFSPLVAFVLLAILRPIAPQRLPTPANDVISQKRAGAEVVVILAVLVSIIVALSWAVSAHAQQTTYRDEMGRTLGTSTRSGNQTTYRDSFGRTLGTATESSSTKSSIGDTTIRDSFGRTISTAQHPR